MSDVDYSVQALIEAPGIAGVASGFDRLGASAEVAAKKLDGLERSASGASKGKAKQFDVMTAGLGAVAGAADLAIGVFDRLAALSMQVAGGVALGAVAGGVAALKTGIVDVNAKLEDMKLGFGTLFSAVGNESFTSGLGLADELIEGIRKDAKALPGEFQDFVGMAQTLSAPLLNAGHGVQSIRDMTRQTVVAAAALGIRYDQAGREMAMLVEGHAGGHNVLGTRLGITANTQVKGKTWNDASSDERMKFLSAMLSKADAALGDYSRSWAGMTSTLSDSWKQFLGVATGPLFDRMKRSLGGVLEYLDKHQGKVDELAHRIGDGLVGAWDWLETRAVGVFTYLTTHWDGIRGKVVQFGAELRDAFEKAWPVIERIGVFLEDKLEHPGRALKEAIAARVALETAKQAPTIAGWFSGGGGGAAGLAGSGGLSGAGGALLGAAGPLAGGLAMLYGAVDVLTQKPEVRGTQTTQAYGAENRAVDDRFNNELITYTETLYTLTGGIAKIAQELWNDKTMGVMANFRAAGENLYSTFQSLWNVVHPLIDLLGLGLIGAIDLVSISLRLLTYPIKLLGEAIDWVVDHIPGLRGQLGAAHPAPKVVGAIAAEDSGPYMGHQLNAEASGLGRGTKNAVVNNNNDFRGSRIEIKVDAKDQDPDRLIRRMFHKLGEASRRGPALVQAPG